MASVAVTPKGQVTLKRDLLQHLGIKPGERIDFEKLPGGELRVRAARPSGTIDKFLHALDGKVTLEEARANPRVRALLGGTFADADTNHDGYIDRKEAAAYLVKRQTFVP